MLETIFNYVYDVGPLTRVLELIYIVPHVQGSDFSRIFVQGGS